MFDSFLKPDFDRHQFERSAGKSKSDHKPDGESRGRRAEGSRDFKRPKLVPRSQSRRGRGGKVPDFVKNPESYTKYSLKDVPELSDRSNSAAAFDFLRQLKEKNNEESEPAADLSQKIVFKKRVKKDVTVKNDETGTEESSKSDLKNVKSKGTKSNQKNKSMQMTLSHLDEEEDDEFQ